MSTVRLRRVTKLRYGDALPAATRADGAIPVYSSGGATGHHDVANTVAPVIVVGRKGSHGTIFWSDQPVFVIDTAYAIDSFVRPTSARWLYYVLRAAGLPRLSHDVGVPGLSRERVHDLRVPNLGLWHQREIADFLDREWERIASVAQARRTQRDVLDLMRGSLARECATGLKQVPLKRAATVVDCKHRTSDYVETEGFPLVSTREVSRGHLTIDATTRRVSKADFDDLREGLRDPRRGDIIYSRNATVGVAAYLADETPVCMGQDVVLITRRPRDCELLSYMLNWGVADQVERLSIGSTFSRINVATIRELVVPDDTPAAEAAVLSALRQEFERIDTLEASLGQSMIFLDLYRDALITEAVTGQLDVTKVSEAQMDERLHEAVEAGPSTTATK